MASENSPLKQNNGEEERYVENETPYEIILMKKILDFDIDKTYYEERFVCLETKIGEMRLENDDLKSQLRVLSKRIDVLRNNEMVNSNMPLAEDLEKESKFEVNIFYNSDEAY